MTDNINSATPDVTSDSVNSSPTTPVDGSVSEVTPDVATDDVTVTEETSAPVPDDVAQPESGVQWQG